MNVAKLKGTHNAMKSGMLAAEAVFDEIVKDQSATKGRVIISISYLLTLFSYYSRFLGLNPESYETKIRNSWIWKELKSTRNVRPSFNTRLGWLGGLLYTGTFYVAGRGIEPWTLSHGSKKYSLLKWRL